MTLELHLRFLDWIISQDVGVNFTEIDPNFLVIFVLEPLPQVIVVEANLSAAHIYCQNTLSSLWN